MNRRLQVLRLNYVAFKTIVIKEVLRFLRIWIQTVLPPAITMGLYLVIFGRLIGERLGPVQQLSYLDFIVPGVILMAAITNSYSNVVSSFFSTKVQRHVEELLISPVSNWIIVMGYVAGGVARGLTVGLVVTGVCLLFTDLRVTHPALSVAILVMTSMLFALAGFINALFARTFDDISIVPTFVLTPLTYLGGVFYSVDMLPPFWQSVAVFNPILYMVNGFRYGLLGVTDIDIDIAVAIVLLFNAGLFVVAVQLVRRGIGIKQ